MLRTRGIGANIPKLTTEELMGLGVSVGLRVEKSSMGPTSTMTRPVNSSTPDRNLVCFGCGFSPDSTCRGLIERTRASVSAPAMLLAEATNPALTSLSRTRYACWDVLRYSVVQMLSNLSHIMRSSDVVAHTQSRICGIPPTTAAQSNELVSGVVTVEPVWLHHSDVLTLLSSGRNGMDRKIVYTRGMGGMTPECVKVSRGGVLG